MSTKGSREQDAIVKKALADSRANDGVEFKATKVNPVGPHHYGAGSIGGGSDTRGTVEKGPGRPGPAEASGST